MALLRQFLPIVISMFAPAVCFGVDPLPSWNEGSAKQSIVDFVGRVTTEGTDDFVPVAERIAVFDNDGTLWTEYPVPNQVAFAFDEIKRMLPEHPEWKDDTSVQAVVDGDVATLLADNHKGLLDVLALTHSGMTDVEFSQHTANWLASTTHPRFKVAYDQTVYAPMIEVLEYLRENGFETWIVSGGGQDFMRVFAEKTYGIPPQQVVGSHARMKYELADGKPRLTKTLEQLFVDDKEGKPVAIAQFIGRRPIACFGNSNGDQAMMEYTTIANDRPSLGVIVHHTDADREYAYDANPSGSGKLTTALEAADERGWTVVDMKKDWKRVWNSAVATSVFDIQWNVEQIDGQAVTSEMKPDITFTKDGKVSGSTGVNRMMGSATIQGTKINFGPLATTRRAGPPESMKVESQLLKALDQTTNIELSAGKLLLKAADGSVMVVLSGAPGN